MSRTALQCPSCEHEVTSALARAAKLLVSFRCPTCGEIITYDNLVRRKKLSIFSGVEAAEEEDLSLDSELERTMLRIYSFDVVPYTARKSSTAVSRVEPPSLVHDLFSAGANRYVESWVERSETDIPFEAPDSADWYSYTYEIACHVGPYQSGTATNTMYAGIQIGTQNSAPPFSSTPDAPYAQLRYSIGRQKWELACAVGDGATAPTVVDLVGITPIVPGGGARARLRYDPHLQKVSAWVGGVLGAEITTQAQLPKFGIDPGTGAIAGIFTTSGTNASGGGYAHYAACHCKLYDFDRPAATLWY